MSWRELFRDLLRLLAWRMRINRLGFIGGFFALQLLGGLFGQLIGVLIGLVGYDPNFVSNNAGLVALLSIPTVFIACGLFASRAHDFGAWGAPFVTPYVSASLLTLWYIATADERTEGQEPTTLSLAMAVAAILTVLVIIALALIPGQTQSNKFGQPPREGRGGN